MNAVLEHSVNSPRWIPHFEKKLKEKSFETEDLAVMRQQHLIYNLFSKLIPKSTKQGFYTVPYKGPQGTFVSKP